MLGWEGPPGVVQAAIAAKDSFPLTIFASIADATVKSIMTIAHRLLVPPISS